MRPIARVALMSRGGRAVKPLSEIAAANVRAESARRGLYGKDLAAILGLSPMAVYDRGRGRTPWALDELQVIARALDLEIAELLTDHSTGGSSELPA